MADWRPRKRGCLMAEAVGASDAAPMQTCYFVWSSAFRRPNAVAHPNRLKAELRTEAVSNCAWRRLGRLSKLGRQIDFALVQFGFQAFDALAYQSQFLRQFRLRCATGFARVQKH